MGVFLVCGMDGVCFLQMNRDENRICTCVTFDLPLPICESRKNTKWSKKSNDTSHKY